MHGAAEERRCHLLRRDLAWSSCGQSPSVWHPCWPWFLLLEDRPHRGSGTHWPSHAPPASLPTHPSPTLTIAGLSLQSGCVGHRPQVSDSEPQGDSQLRAEGASQTGPCIPRWFRAALSGPGPLASPKPALSLGGPGALPLRLSTKRMYQNQVAHWTACRVRRVAPFRGVG